MRKDDLKRRIIALEKRNQRVEIDKAWETSLTRRVILLFLTYLSIGIYMQVIAVPDPWMNAVIPSVGFILSTLTLPTFKNIWTKYTKNKN